MKSVEIEQKNKVLLRWVSSQAIFRQCNLHILWLVLNTLIQRIHFKMIIETKCLVAHCKIKENTQRLTVCDQSKNQMFPVMVEKKFYPQYKDSRNLPSQNITWKLKNGFVSRFLVHFENFFFVEKTNVFAIMRTFLALVKKTSK